jgi:hypothetical protein
VRGEERTENRERGMEPGDVVCPYCGAKKGDPCARSHVYHAERIEAAAAAARKEDAQKTYLPDERRAG